MFFRHIQDCPERILLARERGESVRSRRSVSASLALRASFASALVLASVASAQTAVAVDVKAFTPDSVLNGYWMYMDSTITTSSGQFKTADEGRVGTGDFLFITGDANFKTPTMIGGDLTSATAAPKVFDSSLWVLGDATFQKTTFASAKSYVQVDGTFSFSQNEGDDSAETWAGGAATVYGNTRFRNKLHLKDALTVSSTPLTFEDTVFFDASKINPVTMNTLTSKNFATTTYAPPFSNPVFFDSSKIPGYGLSFAPPTGRRNVNKDYASTDLTNPNTVCGVSGIVCTNYPGVSYKTKSLPSGKVLPPGYYGTLEVDNATVVLGEGVYFFDEVKLQNSAAKLVMYQPTGERTIIYTTNGFSAAGGQVFVGPDSGYIASKFGISDSADDFSGGTVMIVAGPHATIRFDSDASAWATLSTPTGTVQVNSQFTLYGQMFGRHFRAANNFNGGAGKFIPFFPDKPVISFDVKVFKATVSERDLDGSGNPQVDLAKFPLKMSHINGSAVTVWYHTVDVSAQAGGTTANGTRDYVAVTKGSVVIKPTFDTATIVLSVLGDVAFEATETFKVVLDSVTNGSLGPLPTDSFGTGTIIDNESAVLVRLVPVAPTTLTRPAASATDTAFHYKIQIVDPGTGNVVAIKAGMPDEVVKLKLVPATSAEIGVDVTLPSVSVTIPTGSSETDVRVVVPKGDVFRPDAVFQLVIDSAFGTTKKKHADSTATGTVVSPAARIVIGDGTANQSSATSLALPVQLVRVSDGVVVTPSMAIPFVWSTLDSTAKGGVHFDAVSAKPDTLNAGVSTKSVSVALIRTQLYDSTRAFKAYTVPGTVSRLSTAKDTGVGTILNGWGKPAIAINDTVVQRKSTDFVFKVPVRLSRSSALSATYSFAAIDGGAVNGVDYALTAASSAISSTDTVRITIKASKVFDSTRRFVLTIPSRDTSRLAKGDTAAIITITSAITDARVVVDPASADQSKDAKIRFPVRLVDGTGATIGTRVAVPYVFSTVDGSAKAGTHFAAVTAPDDTIAAGAAGIDTFDVALIRTQKYDTTRHFLADVVPTLVLAGLSNAHDTATGTIVNGFAKPVIHVDSSSIVRPATKTAMNFRVWLDRPSAIALPFTWATRNGSAVADTDYVAVSATTTTIDSSLLVPVFVLARPMEFDTTRHLHVDLSNLSAFSNASATAPGAILPALGKPYLWVLPASVFEGPEGKDTSMVFKAELRDSTGASMTSRIPVAFTWKTDAAWAGNGTDSLAHVVDYDPYPADYDEVANGNGTVDALAGSGTFVVRVHGNDLKQPDRVLKSVVTVSAWARLADSISSNIGTILDDDSISTRAYFPRSVDTVSENDSIAWVPVLLTTKALTPDSMLISVNARTTAVRDTNFNLLQPSQTDVHDTTTVPSSVATTVRVRIDAGDSVFWVPVRVRHDSVRTVDMRVVLDLAVLQPASGVKVDPGRSQTTLVIANVDPPPYLGFRDTVLSVVRGQSIRVNVGIRPLRSDKNPSAQFTGSIADTTGGTTPAWKSFVTSAQDSVTPGFSRLDLDTSFAFSTLDDGRDGPDLRVVLRMHDWTEGEALKPLAGDALLRDSVVIWIRNANPASKASFWTDSVTVRDVDGQLTVKVQLDKGSHWNTAASVTRTGEAKDVYLAPDSSVRVTWKPGDTVATFVLKYGNDHKVGSDRRFELHLGDFLHLGAGKDSVLHVRIVNTNQNPVVKITSPSEGAKLGKKDLDSLGKVPVKWTVDGNSMPMYDTLLHEGPSTIVKCYTDEWGNTGCDSVHVTLDTTAPTVVITHVSKDSGRTWLVVSPTDTPWVNETDVLVKWISIDDGDTTRHEDGEILEDSINTVTRCAEDAVGNRGCGSGLVGLDTIPPSVWIENPPNNSHWQAGCIAMVWYEKDDSTKRHDSTVCFSTTGPHVVSVSSTPDRAGNVGHASVTIWIDPNTPSTATYVDTDNDGRIDAVVVQFPRNWTDSMPFFEISYGGAGENTVTSDTVVYGTKSQAGAPYVHEGEAIRVLTGIPVKTEDGKVLRDSDGDIVYQAPGGTPLLDKDGKQVVDQAGVPLWKVAGTGSDSTVLVIKLSEELPYGWTSSTIDSLGVFRARETVVDSAGDTTKADVGGVFDIQDGVAPVIVSANTVRTEDYEGRDVVTIEVSEPIVLDPSGDWFEIKVDGQWVKVPADSVKISDDGKTITLLLPPGEDGVPDPGVEIRFLGGVSDSAGNRVDTDDIDWTVVVTGDPRPPILDVEVVKPIGTISQQEQNRTRKPGFVITATNGGGTDDYTPWRPGEGYLGNGGDQQFRDVCPDVDDCNGLEIEVNHPMRVEVFVYDLLGTHAGGFDFELSQQDLDDLNPDKLDRFRIRVLWNQRGHDGKVVASGIYPWRVVSWTQVDAKRAPVLTNRVVKLGVKTRLQ